MSYSPLILLIAQNIGYYFYTVGIQRTLTVLAYCVTKVTDIPIPVLHFCCQRIIFTAKQNLPLAVWLVPPLLPLCHFRRRLSSALRVYPTCARLFVYQKMTPLRADDNCIHPGNNARSQQPGFCSPSPSFPALPASLFRCRQRAEHSAAGFPAAVPGIERSHHHFGGYRNAVLSFFFFPNRACCVRVSAKNRTRIRPSDIPAV